MTTSVIVGRDSAQRRLLKPPQPAPIAADSKPRRRKGDLILAPVHANRGIQAAYRRRLDDEIKLMLTDTEDEVTRTYRRHYPVLAQDAAPADVLQDEVKKLRKKWTSRFDDLAAKLAAYFAEDVADRSDVRLRHLLKEGGIAVDFRMTPGMRDVLKATVHENVALIKNLPQQYLNQVEGAVMRSVQMGRDMGPLAKFLVEQRGMTKRRAALIARDQNNKATSMFTRVRQIEIGVTEAIWRHSHAGEVPRPSHVKMDGKRYNVAKGMYDPDEGEWIFPSQLINCRCFSSPVIKGFV